MPKLLKSILLASSYILLFNIILFFHKNVQGQDVYIRLIKDLAILIPASIITFYFLLLPTRLISSVIISALFVIGAVNNYFYYTFNKTFDTGVLIDLLTVESSLTQDFISTKLVIIGIVTFVLVFLLNFKITLGQFASRLGKITSYFIVVILVLVISASSNFNKRTFEATVINYLPFSIFYNVYEYYSKFKPHIYKREEKNDLTEQYSFTLGADTYQQPLTVVLIIGESMRGDLISLNGYSAHDNMPRLQKRSNLISFTNATSSTTSTRMSIPYMLTSAVVPDFNQALSEKSVISIFKRLGFTTSWIGNQGIFGIHETTYASDVMEADYYIINKDFRKAIPDRIIYDTDMLPYISKRLQEVQDKHFIVIHMVGSHWSFYKRYPSDMENKFKPECNTEIISQCDKESLFNSYANTIKQSDYFLDEVLKLLENKNSFVLYASDHGFSLGENGHYGNAYAQDDNIPNEQLSIAMFSWGSEVFHNANKCLFAKINSKKNNQIHHGYIFHSLLDCTRVKSPYINKGLSLCQ
ncbi:MAG: sulfatase-like hydrolase/transferase [Rickettsiaceae bacterium]